MGNTFAGAFKDLGRVIVRDVESQAAEFAGQAVEVLRGEIGAALKKAPELERAARKAFISGARYQLNAMTGKAVPADAMDQVTAQLDNVKVSGEIIAAAAFRSIVAGILKAGLGALSSATGGIAGALAGGLEKIIG